LRGLNLWSVWSDHKALTQLSEEVLEAVAMNDKQNTPVASLPHGDQRKLEVALLMALEPDVFMFDEPTAGMSADEAPVILDLIRKLKDDKRKTILLVEHKMDVVRELADRIIVLHNGTLVADGDPATVIASPVVQEAYLGVSPTPAQAEPAEGPATCAGRTQWRRRMSQADDTPRGTAHPVRRAHPHRRVPHPAWRGPGRATRTTDHAAGPQWCWQDHHAAHHHGPVACVARQAGV
jgi:ABC-type multidrug transport system ATPase subunit